MKQQEGWMPRASAERFAALSRVGTALMSEVEEAAVLRLIAHTARDLTGAAFAAFALRPVTEEGELLVPAESSLFHLAVVVGLTHEQEARLRRVLLSEEGLLAPIFEHGEPVRIPDALPLLRPAEGLPISAGQDAADQTVLASAQGLLRQKERRSKRQPRDHPVVRSFLAAPLLDHTGQVRGGLLLGHPEPGQFSKEDESLLVSLAAQTALALEKARFYRMAQMGDQQPHAVLESIADGVTLERELVARTRQAEAIFEAMTEGVLIYDRSGNIVLVNTAGRRLLGIDVVPDYASRPPEERLPLYIMQDLQGQVLAQEHWPLRRVLQGEVLVGGKVMEVLMRTLDGRQIQASYAGAPLRDQDGRVIGAVLTVRDLSERYRLERRLQEAEREASERASQLEAIFEAMPEALLALDCEGHITRMNAAGRQLFERIRLIDYTAAPFAERAAQVAVWGEHGQSLARESFPNARILTGEVLTPVQPVEITMRDQQGEAIALSITGGPLRDTQGQLVGAVTISRDITERKRAELALQQQAQQLQLQANLIELAHDAILVRDPQSQILSWNRGAERLYGWTAQEARGRMTHTLLQTRFPVSLAAVEAQLESEGQWEGELRHTRRDGTEVLVESCWAMVRDEAGRPTAILEINRDITERRRLEELKQQLQEETEAQRAVLQLVLDELPSSVYLVRGRDARLILANCATTVVWGATWARHQPMSEFLRQNGIRILGVDGKALPPEPQATWRALLQGEAVSQYQEIIRQPDGKTLPVLVNAVPLDLSPLFPLPGEGIPPGAEGTEPAALVVHQDVTALKEAERLKDEFIAIAAHELRNPLAVLKGYVHTLLFQHQQGRGPELAEWQREALHEIDTATLHLVKLTEALLDVTRLQAGRLELHAEPTDLVALSRHVVKRLQRTTEQHRLSLRTSQEHLVVHLDPGRIEQVLSNLIGNAIKYSPQGGLVEVTVWEEHEEAVLGVRDQGIGIPTQQQARIFGRFFRANNTRKLAGTGLGLYICRALVELHGGRLWFESVEEHGSTFFMALPNDEEKVPSE